MIYLDNAATSCPKPPEVVRAVQTTLEESCANPGRGAYEGALEAGRILLRTRRSLARLCGIGDEGRVTFALNATQALNFAIKGLLGTEGGHVVVSSVEHNSVVRPLVSLAGHGVEFTRIPCASDGTTDPDDVLAAVRSDTRLVALTHASNVLGTVLPVAEVGPRLRERGITFLVDAAQTAGVFPLDVEAMGIDLLAIPGHKGLLGPQGVGVLYVAPHLELMTLIEGGTGGNSESLEPPVELPDRLEAGTVNTPGVAGLGAGVELVLDEGVDEIGERERRLADGLRRDLVDMEGVRVYGPGPGEGAAPVVSVNVEGVAAAEVAFILDRAFDVAARAGLHCSPESHRVAGTFDEGTVRLSVGHATAEEDVNAAVEAFAQIVARATARK